MANDETQDAERSTLKGKPKVLGFPKFARPVVQVVLWDEPGRPVEDALRGRLVEGGYGVVRWANEPATGYPPHAHIYPELLWLISGSLTVILPAENRMLELMPGDRIEVPQGVVHGTMAGADGAVYLLATR
jgi:quercetin dioxygenase-like cupin family protein